MATRRWIGFVGAVYLVVGVLGFFPAFRTAPPPSAPHLVVTADYGYLFGLLPINVLHNVFNIVIGLGALAAFPGVQASGAYSRFLFLLFGLMTFLGFLPHIDTLYGYLPFYGADVWPHAATAILSGHFGWVALAETHVAPAHEGSP